MDKLQEILSDPQLKIRFRRRLNNFERAHCRPSSLGLVYQADLAVVDQYKRFNGGISFLLIVVGMSVPSGQKQQIASGK